MRSMTRSLFVVAGALAALSFGCSAGNNQQTGSGASGGGTNSGGNGGAGASGGAGGNGGENIGGFGASGGGNTSGNGAGGGEVCAGAKVKGELVPLDMYIMLDKSGSMLDKTGAAGTGPSKWDAVTGALKAFFADPGSDGLGVGIQFFPINKPGVPETCTTNAQCGSAGPCFLKACELELSLGSLVPCATDTDCGFFNTCVTLGQCQNDPTFVCQYQTPELGCGLGPNGDLGLCKTMTESFCSNPDSCSGADYGKPAVEIATLNGSAAALSAAIDAKEPAGATPTGPALDGAIKHSKSWAMANTDHKVVAVLATDGLPTECTPVDITDIANIAKAGANGTPSIPTFVIGVFGAGDVGAQQNLDQIAKAGGTNKAFFITSNQDVTQAFLDALKAIQGETLACEYQIPLPTDGSDLDYGKVNVQYTPAGASMAETIFYVGDPSKCDPMIGGWYYDKDPLGAVLPTKILMCPTTCSKLKGVGGEISIEIGCETIVPEPK